MCSHDKHDEFGDQRIMPLRLPALLRRLYVKERKSTHRIADELGVHPESVRRALKAADIPLRRPWER